MDHNDAAALVRSLYDDGGDPSFRAVLDLVRPAEDRQLAAVIEVDGRLRLALGRDLSLDRYLESAHLEDRPTALDAAIDVALRAWSRRSAPGQGEVEALVRSYPALERPIREAASLGHALRSTTSIRRRIKNKEPLRRLPCELGPQLADGRPRYELLELVGEGGTGAVYRAVDRHLSDTGAEATVAIKIFAPPDDEAFAQWMREEALKARRVNHQNVVRALDRGETGDCESYIVYEFVDGGDLGDLIRRRGVPMPAREAARLVAAVARGVQAIHTAGLVHCDLKPGNIALTDDGVPKVADFGIAMREGQAPGIELTAPGSPFGSFAFISPEQLHGDPGAYSFPSDIYALGAMLAHLVSGQLPNGETPEEIRTRHADPRPVTLGGNFDRDLRRIVARATAVDPFRRHSSAGELADDLVRWSHRRPLAWGRTGPLRRASLFARRRPVLTAVATVAVFAAGAAAGVKVREDLRRYEATSLLEAFLSHYAASDVGGENLPQLSMWENFSQGTYFEGHPLSLHDHQVDILRRLLALPEITEETDSSDALLLRSALALALASREGDYLEAEPLARECRARWSRRFGEEDPMVHRMAVVEAAAAVNRYLAEHDHGATLDAGVFHATRATLKEAHARLPARDARGPLPKLVETQLDKLEKLDRVVAAAR
jgi:hypothetical protein